MTGGHDHTIPLGDVGVSVKALREKRKHFT